MGKEEKQLEMMATKRVLRPTFNYFSTTSFKWLVDIWPHPPFCLSFPFVAHIFFNFFIYKKIATRPKSIASLQQVEIKYSSYNYKYCN